MTGDKPWTITQAFKTAAGAGAPSIEFVFDERGRQLFSGLTTRFEPDGVHIYQLAIVLDGKILSAPNLMSPITGGSCIIQGAKGWTDQDEQLIVEQLQRLRP